MQKGEIDIIVDSFDFDPKGFVYTPLLSEKILLAVPQSVTENNKIKDLAAYPTELYFGEKNANSLAEVSIEHFKDESFILLKSGNSMYEHAMRIFKKNGVIPHIGFFLDQLSTSYFLCAQGDGCAFVTDTIFKYHKFDDSILLYNVHESSDRTFGIAYKEDSYTPRIIKRFVEVSKESIT